MSKKRSRQENTEEEEKEDWSDASFVLSKIIRKDEMHTSPFTILRVSTWLLQKALGNDNADVGDEELDRARRCCEDIDEALSEINEYWLKHRVSCNKDIVSLQ